MWRHERRRRAVAALLLVLAGHAGLWLLLQARSREREPAAPHQLWLNLRLLPAPAAPAAPPPRTPRPAAPPRRQAAAAAATVPRPADRAAEAITLPAADVAAEAAAVAEAVAAAASAASAPPPLRLLLPHGVLRALGSAAPALDDPRSNSGAAVGVEARIGRVTGDGRWRVEPLSDGRRRYRRGADCVVVQPSRAGQLFPFNGAVDKPPDLAGPC